MENSADSEIGSKQNNGLHCKWTVKSRCLLKIEALDTTILTIDDVAICNDDRTTTLLRVA